jgi:hypothetical protein
MGQSQYGGVDPVAGLQGAGGAWAPGEASPPGVASQIWRQFGERTGIPRK